MELQEIVERIREGETAEFARLVAGYRDMAFGYALTLLDQEQMAEDVVQEALLIAYTHLDRLRQPQAFGAWLRANGEAVYGARPWTQAEAVTAEGMPTRFTQKDGTIYLIVLGLPSGGEVRLRDLSLTGKGRALMDGSPVSLRREGEDSVLGFASPLKGEFAPAIAIESAKSIS